MPKPSQSETSIVLAEGLTWEPGDTGSGRGLYPHIRRAIDETPWAILPAKLAQIIEVVDLRSQGIVFSAEEIQARIGAAQRPAYGRSGSIAVLPMYGVIAQRMSLMGASSGGTSTEAFSRSFREALADDTVGTIVIDVDSPGGSVAGVAELADEIYQARGRKPIVAVANSLAASAAYWIASAADEFVVTPSGEVGSIGVFGTHQNLNGWYEQAGVEVTLISAGKYKTEGHPYGPLDDEARAAFQERVDDYYGMFVSAVARHRGVKAGEVKAGFGEGRAVGAREAVRLGMVDRVATMSETLVRLAGGPRAARTRADGSDSGLVVHASADAGETSPGDLERRRRRLRLMGQARERRRTSCGNREGTRT